MNAARQEIVITGMGLVTCLGLDVASAWRGVTERRRGIGPLTRLECVPEGTPPADVPWTGGQAPDPTAGDENEPRETALLRSAIDEAWREAGLGDDAPYRADRCGYVLGTTLHGMRQAGTYLRTGELGRFADFLAGATLRRAARDMPLRGPMLTTCAACSSGLGSIGLALTLLRSGVLDLVVAGGYDPISEYAYAGFGGLRLIAAGPTRPFSKGRDGLTIGEGYGVMVLERGADAAARGAATIARVLAVGESCDAHHLTQPHPEGEGSVRAIRAAMESAGVDPEEVGLIAAHATGTPGNDAAEAAALHAVFGDRLVDVPVVAFKSHIGHTLGGAGAAELILSAAALREETVPPTVNTVADEIEFPAISLNTGPARRGSLDTTLNLSLGFGGANACAMLGHARRASPSHTTLRPPALREVVITGVGVVLPGAIGNEEFAALLTGPPPATSPAAGPIDEDRYAHLLSARRLRRLSGYVKLTLAATAMAYADAGITDPRAFSEECSAILGTTHGSTAYSEAYYTQVVNEGMAAANPMLFAEGVPNAAAAQLSMMFGVKGFCQTIVGTRTAGLDALWLAGLRIASGQWERAVVSAAEEFSPLSERAYGPVTAGRASIKRPEVEGWPFATASGAVAFILESRTAAAARGAHPLGALTGGAALSTPRLAGWGGVSAVRRCLEQLGNPTRILSAGNGTWIDRVERAGIAASRRGRVPAIITHHRDRIAETFSAGPLAAIAGALLSGRAGGGVSAAGGSYPSTGGGGLLPLGLAARGAGTDEVVALCVDYSGLVTGVSVRLLSERVGAALPGV